MNASATFFLHDGDTEIGDYTAAGTLLRRYIPGDAIEPVAMVTPGQNGAPETQSFVHTDKMGSVIAMSGAGGALTEGPYTYDAYGNGAPATGIPFKFTGQRLDPETGLYYYRARYYSAGLGRFLQTDPIGYKDDVDLYTYVGDDPTDFIDPTGKYFIGLTAGATAEAGYSSCNASYCNSRAEAGQVSIYGAAFWGGKHVAAGVGIARGHLTGHTYGKDSVKGAYAGLGAGVTFGNATNNDQLKGPFDTTSWDFFIISIQIAKSGDIWQESVTVGPGAVGAISHYDTDTKTAGGSDTSNESADGNSGTNKTGTGGPSANNYNGTSGSNGSGRSPLFGQTVRI